MGVTDREKSETTDSLSVWGKSSVSDASVQLPVSVDVEFGLIWIKHLALTWHTMAMGKRLLDTIGIIITGMLEGSFLKSWLLWELLQCLKRPPGGTSAQ